MATEFWIDNRAGWPRLGLGDILAELGFRTERVSLNSGRPVTMTYDAKFLEIAEAEGVPHPPSSLANYIPTRRVGNVLYVSGQGPFKGAKIVSTGKLGAGLTIEEGKAAARITGLNLLYNVRDALRTLDNVECIIAIDGMVNCTPDFEKMPDVIDGCSDLFVEIFADAGKHTRSAVGHVALPFAISVEIQMQVQVVKSFCEY